MNKSNRITLKRGCLLAIIVYIIIVFMLYVIGGNEIKYKQFELIKHEDGNTPVGEIVKGHEVEQDFILDSNVISQLSLKFATYTRQNKGTVNVNIINKENNNVLFSKDIDVSTLEDNKFLDIKLDKLVEDIKGKPLKILLKSDNEQVGNAVTVWYNNILNLEGQNLRIDGKEIKGVLCFKIVGGNQTVFGKYYFVISAITGIILLLYFLNLIVKSKNGKKSFGLNILNSFIKYRFLLKQLVSRDFKTKYKRSVLGVLWSFLNPLLTMMVQYFVFCTLFKTDIKNFPVYLMIGIVLFNYFSEATTMSLMSIVGNATLITKVYVPKYIYPISRVLSSTINLLFSMIPLLIMILMTKVPITAAFLLLPFVIICLLIFCVGVGFILSSMMVFFRDTQFLWGVIIMLWTYITPIFYPETIIPEKFMNIYRINPMYHYVKFVRIVILNGVSPEPKEYLLCIISSLLTLLIGAFIFKKTQDRFILNI
jgi:ABC-2 type transport system permease protein